MRRREKQGLWIKIQSHRHRILIGAGLLALFALLAFNIFGILFVLSKAFWPAPAKTNQDYKLLAKMRVVATAYSSTVDQTDSSPCITANGYNVCAHYSASGTVDTVAANFLPMNSIIKIPELFGDEKVFVVRDRMNSRYGPGRIDLWLPERDDAVEFGKRPLMIEVYK